MIRNKMDQRTKDSITITAGRFREVPRNFIPENSN